MSALKVVATREARAGMIFEMEAPLLDASGLTKALIMAIAGEHRVAMETDEMNDALERLAIAIDDKLNDLVNPNGEPSAGFN